MLGEKYLKRLKQVECPDATFYSPDSALVFEKAHGSIIYDVDGKPYIDLCCGFGVLALGHNHPVMQETLRSVINDDLIIHGMGDVYPSKQKIEFLEFLKSILPKHLEKGAFALSGAGAVEIAVKSAMLYTKADGFLSFHGNYHGTDLGVLPLTSKEFFKKPFLPFIKTEHMQSVPFNCDREQIESAVREQKQKSIKTAAIIVEPIQGRNGVIMPKQGWLAMLRSVCDVHQILLIFDEVFVGLGRNGVLTHAFEVPADLVCLGKALGGGFPISCCFGKRQIMDSWPENSGEALHTGTFFGHPLSCLIGQKTLSYMLQEQLIDRANLLGNQFLFDLQARFLENPKVKDIRGKGLMIAIEFKETSYGAAVMHKLRQLGVIALCAGQFGETLTLTPAFTISEELLRVALSKIEECL